MERGPSAASKPLRTDHESLPTNTLLAAACIVGASAVALPQVTGHGTILFQLVALGAWGIVARITSGRYADTRHPVVWSVSLVLNLMLFLVGFIHSPRTIRTAEMAPHSLVQNRSIR